jgi:hypothetical protein
MPSKYTKPTHICIACDQHCWDPICRFCRRFDDPSIRDAEDLRAHIRSARGLGDPVVINIKQEIPPFQAVHKRKWGKPIERKRRTVGRGVT